MQQFIDIFARSVHHTIGILSTPPRQGRRGIALIIVMATVAIMSTAVVEFAYQTNVNSALSANSRDELKASYMARSAMNLAVLLIGFQYELEQDPLVGRFMRNSNFQFYPLINLFLTPFSSGQLDTPVGGVDLAGGGASGFGGFHGSFRVDVQPEEGKLNINAYSSAQQQRQITWLCLLMNGEEHDDLFDTDIGSSRDAVRRTELVGNMIDFVDPDKTKVLLNDFCVPEGAGSGDEGGAYARGDIEPKNAKLTTIEELRQVAGMNDAIFDRFAESFTIYPVDRVNLNLADYLVIQSLLCANVSGSALDNWPCRDPNVLTQVTYLALALDGLREFFANPLNLLFYYMNSDNASRVLQSAKTGQTVAYLNTRQLERYIREFKASPETMAQFISYSPTAQRLLGPAALQLAVAAPPIIIDFNFRNMLRSVTTRSPRIFKIVAEGSYGDARSTMVSVVDFSKKKNARYLYWREY